MKKLFMICLCLAVAGIIGCSKGSQEAEASHWKKATILDHEAQGNEYGVGTDVILHEGEDGEILNKVTAEYRYDWNNEVGNHKAYVVATTKLADIWAKLKGLLNKGE